MRFLSVTLTFSLAALTAATPPHIRERIGVAIPINKRSVLLNADKSVNVSALRSHVVTTKNKVTRGLLNFEKNTGSPHPAALKKRNRKRDASATELINDGHSLWFGTISVGTPPSDFTGMLSGSVSGGATNSLMVDSDTGSSDLFLPGPDCVENYEDHNIYDPSGSSTAQDLGSTFNSSFGDKSGASGDLFTDIVTIAGLTAVDQTVGAASKYSAGFAVDIFLPDGMLGMGFDFISTGGGSPVFQTLVSQGQTDDPVFSFKLTQSGGSELFLGGTNPDLYAGDFTYTPVTQPGFWEVDLDSIDVDGATLLSNISCMIDTGTSLIVGNPLDVAALYALLGGIDASDTVGEGHYVFPCASFPSISPTFGGTSFPISSDTLNIGPVSPKSDFCISGIVGQDTGNSLWIIGDVFLQNVNLQVGFAQLA